MYLNYQNKTKITQARLFNNDNCMNYHLYVNGKKKKKKVFQHAALQNQLYVLCCFVVVIGVSMLLTIYYH